MVNPLVFVPGLLCDERLWGPQIERLGEARETMVADIFRDASIPGMARRILEHAPDKFSLCGLSMGGYVALEVMRHSPERVERLALLDTSARPDTPEQTEARLGLVRLGKENGLERVARTLLPRLLHPSRLGDERLVSTVFGMAISTGIEAFRRQEGAIVARNDTREVLPSIECPTLVLCGREDVITAVELHEELARNIPGAKLRVIEECGHLSTLERPEEANTALREWMA